MITPIRRRIREREARALSETKRTREAAVPEAVTSESIAPTMSIENITPF
jgi:hypothetical protein